MHPSLAIVVVLVVLVACVGYSFKLRKRIRIIVDDRGVSKAIRDRVRLSVVVERLHNASGSHFDELERALGIARPGLHFTPKDALISGEHYESLRNAIIEQATSLYLGTTIRFGRRIGDLIFSPCRISIALETMDDGGLELVGHASGGGMDPRSWRQRIAEEADVKQLAASSGHSRGGIDRPVSSEHDSRRHVRQNLAKGLRDLFVWMTTLDAVAYGPFTNAVGTSNIVAARAFLDSLDVLANEYSKRKDDARVAPSENRLTPEVRLRAIDLLENALDADPGFVLGRYNLAMLRFGNGRVLAELARAEAEFRHALDACEALSRGSDTARSTTVARRRYRGTFRQSVNELLGFCHFGLARCLALQQHIDRQRMSRGPEARRHAQKAMDLLGETATTLYARAFAGHCDDDFEGLKHGLADYERAIALDPQDVMYTNASYVCARIAQKLWEDAGSGIMADLDEAVRVEIESYCRRGIALGRVATDRSGIYGQGLRHLALTNIGQCQRLMGDLEGAVATYRECLSLSNGEIDPDATPEGLGEFSDALGHQAIVEENAEAMQRALELHERAIASAETSGQKYKLARRHLRALEQGGLAAAAVERLKRLVVRCFEEQGVQDPTAVWMKTLRSVLGPPESTDPDPA
ncbi:MAG: tetratricopeptide repeat protein [Planctomycetota bacterium]